MFSRSQNAKFYLGFSQQPYGSISETWIASLKRIKEWDSLLYKLRKLQRWGQMLANPFNNYSPHSSGLMDLLNRPYLGWWQINQQSSVVRRSTRTLWHISGILNRINESLQCQVIWLKIRKLTPLVWIKNLVVMLDLGGRHHRWSA